MSDLDIPPLRRGAFARTPFGTPFFVLFTHPELDITGFCKRRVADRLLREELAAWENLRRSGKLSTNNSDAAPVILQEDSASSSSSLVGGGEAAERIAGEGSGAGYPTDYSVLVVDGPGVGDSEGAAAATDNSDGDSDNSDGSDDSLWPETYSTGTDEADIDCEVDGFVIMHRDHATGGSVSWNHKPRRRRRRKVSLSETFRDVLLDTDYHVL